MPLHIKDELAPFYLCSGGIRVKRSLFIQLKEAAAPIMCSVDAVKGKQGTGGTAARDEKLPPSLS